MDIKEIDFDDLKEAAETLPNVKEIAKQLDLTIYQINGILHNRYENKFDIKFREVWYHARAEYWINNG